MTRVVIDDGFGHSLELVNRSVQLDAPPEMDLFYLRPDGLSDEWYAPPASRAEFEDNPADHGGFWPDEWFMEARTFAIRGALWTRNSSLGQADARRRIAQLHNRPLTVMIEDEAGERWVTGASTQKPIIERKSIFRVEFTIFITCPDPIKYGREVRLRASGTEEVARQFLTNPLFRGSGDWAEVRRNLAQSPIETATRSGWRASSSNALVEISAERSLPGRTHSAKCTLRDGWTSTPGVYQSTPGNGGPVPSGKTAAGERVGCWVWLEAGRTIRFQIAEVSPTGSIVGSRMVARTYPGTGDWQWIEGVTTVAKTNAANALCAWPYALAADNGGGSPIFSWWVSAPLNQADAQPGPQFDGGSPDRSIDPDMRTRFIGAENASSSVMEIERVSGVAAQRCIAGVSSRGGKPAMRLIATSPYSTVSDTYSYVSLSIPAQARSAGTLMATRHQDRVIEPPFTQSYTGVRVAHPIQWEGANRAGATPLRLFFERLTSQFTVNLGHGGAAGSPDVWYTDAGLFAGEYSGPAFSGDTPPSGYRTYRWLATPNGSYSVAVDTFGPTLEVENTGDEGSWPVIYAVGRTTIATVELGDYMVAWQGVAPNGFVLDPRDGIAVAPDGSPVGRLAVDDVFKIPPGKHTVRVQTDGRIDLGVSPAWQ